MINVKQNNEFNEEKKIKLKLPFVTKIEDTYFLHYRYEGYIRCVDLTDGIVLKVKYESVQDLLKSIQEFEEIIPVSTLIYSKKYNKTECE